MVNQTEKSEKFQRRFVDFMLIFMHYSMLRWMLMRKMGADYSNYESDKIFQYETLRGQSQCIPRFRA